jgi:hypothetical protein
VDFLDPTLPAAKYHVQSWNNDRWTGISLPDQNSQISNLAGAYTAFWSAEPSDTPKRGWRPPAPLRAGDGSEAQR